MAKVLVDARTYQAVFELLFDDLRRLFQYVEPVNAHLLTYSHRTYELFLRAATEFESICKDALIAKGHTKKPKDMNINDYKTLELDLKLDDLEIGFFLWNPSPRYVKPFQSWSTASPPLQWYSDYNKVKHNRKIEFERANIENLVDSMCSVFAILAKLNVFQQTSMKGISHPGAVATHETFYGNYAYSIRERV